MMAACRCVVSGRVQGVFFRASTCQEAQRRGILGWVRNRSDGSVEVMACAERQALEAFCDWLRQGPAQARVDNVACEPVEPEEFDGFSVR
jgi:acylphosphatase